MNENFVTDSDNNIESITKNNKIKTQSLNINTYNK